jgi:hypothetical protein
MSELSLSHTILTSVIVRGVSPGTSSRFVLLKSHNMSRKVIPGSPGGGWILTKHTSGATAQNRHDRTNRPVQTARQGAHILTSSASLSGALCARSAATSRRCPAKEGAPPLAQGTARQPGCSSTRLERLPSITRSGALKARLPSCLSLGRSALHLTLP